MALGVGTAVGILLLCIVAIGFIALLTERHLPQLTYYAAAIEKIFEKRPASVLIYSLALGKAVSLPL